MTTQKEASKARAEWAEAAIEAFCDSCGEGPHTIDEDTIADLIADCLHLAKQKGMSPQEVLHRAARDYKYEDAHPDEEADVTLPS
jgi:hypothetical protein